MKILIVVQARMGSTRLPGKVLRELGGKPLLERMLERLRAARSGAELMVATTTDPQDEPIRRLCRTLGVACFSGHPTDLLDRHVQAARSVRADAVVKIPSDCPLIDAGAVERVIGAFRESAGQYDLVTNLLPATWPDGNDVEVVPFPVLEAVWREARRPLEREHTTPFLWEHPERFRILNVRWETGLDYSRSHRFTIDYPEDFAVVAAVFSLLARPERPVFPLSDVLELLERRPELASLNARWAGSSWQKRHASELRSMRLEHGEPRWVQA